jgi:hypothetical protein
MLRATILGKAIPLSEPVVDHYRAKIVRCQLEFFVSVRGACNETQKIDNPSD